MSLTELRALAARWTEAANARSQYGGEDATSSALRICAQELEELLHQIGLVGTDDSDLGGGYATVADLTAWIGGVSQSTVRRWLRNGRFPGAWQLDNGEWRIPRVAALEFVEKRKPTASQASKVRKRTERYDRRTFIRRFQSKEAV